MVNALNFGNNIIVTIVHVILYLLFFVIIKEVLYVKPTTVTSTASYISLFSTVGQRQHEQMREMLPHCYTHETSNTKDDRQNINVKSEVKACIRQGNTAPSSKSAFNMTHRKDQKSNMP